MKQKYYVLNSKADCLKCKYYCPATYHCGSTCDRGRYAFPQLIAQYGCTKYQPK